MGRVQIIVLLGSGLSTGCRVGTGSDHCASWVGFIRELGELGRVQIIVFLWPGRVKGNGAQCYTILFTCYGSLNPTRGLLMYELPRTPLAKMINLIINVIYLHLKSG